MSAKFPDDRTTDLFGNPVRESHGKRGRPPLQLGPEERDRVEAALARGWSSQRIANAVGISLASLKRYFRAELRERDVMRDRLELAANARLIRAAIEDGNMTAMKQLRELMERDALAGKKRRIDEQQREAQEAGVGMGKKAAQQKAAEQAAQDEEWGDLLGQPDRLN